jgi:hypothetical protein
MNVVDNADFTVADRPMDAKASAVTRKTPTCTLRLFVILLVDDKFYPRLLNESRKTPNRQQLDAGQVGDNTLFWKDVHECFVDDAYKIPSLPTAHSCFLDKSTGLAHDITVCKSKWATYTTLRKWYNDAHNQLATYVANYDRSGEHEFSFSDIDVFIERYVHGNKDVSYLATLASWRGTNGQDMSTWFKDELPDHVEVLDGMMLTPAPIPKTVGRPQGKSKPPEDWSTLDDAESRLVNAIESLSHKVESPKRAAYYNAKKQDVELKLRTDERNNGLEFANTLKRNAVQLEGTRSPEGKKKAKAYRAAADKIVDKYMDLGLQEYLGVGLDMFTNKNDSDDDNDN